MDLPERSDLRNLMGRAIDRRGFLTGAGLLAATAGLAACTKGSTSSASTPSTGAAPAGSLNQLASGLRQISAESASDTVNPGSQIFTFALVDTDNSLVQQPAKLYLAQTPAEKALGPFDATWYDFTGYASTGDQSPESPLSGVSVATIDLPKPPTDKAVIWTLLATSEVAGKPVGGLATLQVTTAGIVAGIGSKAISDRTPVATTPAKIAEICTRKPVCPLHTISIDDALRSGRPSVLCFATPLLCESMLCGPVLDEVMLVAQQVGDKANVIHLEEFLPGPKLKPPAATLENQSPAFKAWGFQSEPWVIVVDKDGIIRGRLGPGASVAPEIMQVLRPLL